MYIKRIVAAFARCAFGLALILLGYVAGSKQLVQNDAARKSPSAESKPPKSQARWNPALASLVMIVPELGFGVTGQNDAGTDADQIIKKIEAQLLGLRQLYRQEVEKNPALMGHLVLQLAVDSSGNVIDARELTSRISNDDFKQAVIGEASKWQFREIISDSVSINLPLLFVGEGMDVTTLLQWEKTLGSLERRATEVQSVSLPMEQGRPRESTSAKVVSASEKRKSSRQRPESSAATPALGFYELKYSTKVRKEPSFESALLTEVPGGTKVEVVAVRGSWLEIRPKASGPTGFIRSEFAAPVGRNSTRGN
jgi:hypothetical protein